MKHSNIPPRLAAPRADARAAASDFIPVALHARHNGWTPERQVAFIEALAESACVTRAAEAAGLSATAAYNLRRRPEAQAFRLAWDAALDFGVRRLADAALSRAVHGVARPVFYQGEQIGERRYYDERLTQFILRLRDPVRFGKWRDAREPDQHVDGPALLLSELIDLAEEAAFEGEEAGAAAALPDPRRFVAALGLDPERYGIGPRDEDEEDEEDEEEEEEEEEGETEDSFDPDGPVVSAEAEARIATTPLRHPARAGIIIPEGSDKFDNLGLETHPRCSQR